MEMEIEFLYENEKSLLDLLLKLHLLEWTLWDKLPYKQQFCHKNKYHSNQNTN